MSAVQLADGVWRLSLAPQDRLNALLIDGGDGTSTSTSPGSRTVRT